MRIRILFLLLLWPCFVNASGSSGRHVVLISIDGLRPDAITEQSAPLLMKMRAQGLWASDASTITPSITLPSHTSMLTGRTFASHHVDWNGYEPSRGFIQFPTFLQIATEHGLRAAMIVGKEKLKHLSPPGAMEYFSFPGSFARDVVADLSAYVAQKGFPNLVFLHFSDPDLAGHTKGWMSPEYLAAVKASDDAFGIVQKVMMDAGVANSAYVIVTADHGGLGTSHDKDIPEDRHIPWIISGPCIAKGVIFSPHIDTYDTAATVLSLLGLKVPLEWEAKAVNVFMGNNALNAVRPFVLQHGHAAFAL